MKRTLKRESKVPEIVKGEGQCASANSGAGDQSVRKLPCKPRARTSASVLPDLEGVILPKALALPFHSYGIGLGRLAVLWLPAVSAAVWHRT